MDVTVKLLLNRRVVNVGVSPNSFSIIITLNCVAKMHKIYPKGGKM